MRIRNTTPDDPRRCEKCLCFVQHYIRCSARDSSDGYKPCEYGECIYGRTRQTSYAKTCEMFADREETLDRYRRLFGV